VAHQLLSHSGRHPICLEPSVKSVTKGMKIGISSGFVYVWDFGDLQVLLKCYASWNAIGKDTIRSLGSIWFEISE
jgi:hypothetical protein